MKPFGNRHYSCCKKKLTKHSGMGLMTGLALQNFASIMCHEAHKLGRREKRGTTAFTNYSRENARNSSRNCFKPSELSKLLRRRLSIFPYVSSLLRLRYRAIGRVIAQSREADLESRLKARIPLSIPQEKSLTTTFVLFR